MKDFLDFVKAPQVILLSFGSSDTYIKFYICNYN